MAMVSTYGDFLAQKKKNEQIRATAGKLGTPVTGNPSTPGNPATQAGGITGANGVTGANDPYRNSGQIGYAEGLSKYYGIGNNGTGAQMSQPQSLGEALGGGNLVSAAKPVSGSTQRTSGTSGRQNAMSSPVTYAEFGYGGGTNAGLTPKEQYGISYAEGFDLMNRAETQKLSAPASGPKTSRVTIDGGSSGSSGGTGTGNTGDISGDLNLKLINGKTVRVPINGTDDTVKPGELPPDLVDKLPPHVKEQIGADKTTISPSSGENSSGDGKDDTTSGDGGMTYGEYLDKYYGGDAAEKNFDNAIDSAETDYARAKATYGQKAETLGRMGLTGSGYGDYLEGLAYSEMQGAKQNAALTRDKQKAEQQRSYGEYLENKKNTLSQNYQNWLVTSANKTYDLDTMKGMLAEQVKNGDLTQAHADAIIGNYGKGSDAGSAEQRPAILSKLTAQIVDAGLTDEAKIRAAIAAYQGAYGVTLTEDEITGIISNIQGITGKGSTGTGTDADGETPPSETVAAAYNALLSTDANGNLIYGNASDEYLKHLLINSGYEAADAEEAIRRFRKTVESGKSESVDQAVKNTKNSLTFGMANQLIQSGGYSFDSDEAKEIMRKIQEKNGKLIEKLMTDGFDIEGTEATQILSALIGENEENWNSLSESQKWDAIRQLITDNNDDIDPYERTKFLTWYYKKALDNAEKNLKGMEMITKFGDIVTSAANDNGGDFTGNAVNDIIVYAANKMDFAFDDSGSTLTIRMENGKVEYSFDVSRKKVGNYKLIAKLNDEYSQESTGWVTYEGKVYRKVNGSWEIASLKRGGGMGTDLGDCGNSILTIWVNKLHNRLPNGEIKPMPSDGIIWYH